MSKMNLNKNLNQRNKKHTVNKHSYTSGKFVKQKTEHSNLTSSVSQVSYFGSCYCRRKLI